jgi:nondiscriminating glutamyl-tRNA synthetase
MRFCRMHFSFTISVMLEKSIKTRFAPSPTGNLHLGNARTALFNALLARKFGSVFLLRIEDTDQSRSRPEYSRVLQEDLHWLGLVWQEGPEADLSHGPYYQSQRGDIYRSHYDALIKNEHAYPCFCSARELKQIRKVQLAAGQPPRYPGTCARLSRDEIECKLSQGAQPSLRFRVPQDAVVEFEDLVRGSQRYLSSAIGDFVIRRSDFSPAFFYSNALDDALMGVTHVLRGEDHLGNTPRQLLVLKALNYQAPTYGHLALLLGEDGGPLSKRRGAKSVLQLREEGYLPQAVINYLARLGHVYEHTGFLSSEDLAKGFSLSRLGRAPARADFSQLSHWQAQAIARCSEEALWSWLSNRKYMDAQIEDLVPDDLRTDFVRAIRANVELPADGFKLARDLFGDTPNFSTDAQAVIRQAGESFFACALAHLPSTAADFKGYAQSVGKAVSLKGKDLFMPLRAALTGETHGPEMARVFPLIGVERARKRLQAALGIAIN